MDLTGRRVSHGVRRAEIRRCAAIQQGCQWQGVGGGVVNWK